MPSTPRMIIARHGQTEWNVNGRCQGHLDVGLDSTGLEQAECLARELAVLKPTVIVSSDLLRAMKTAEPLARSTKVDLIPDQGLREVYIGKWQGLTYEEVSQKMPEEYAAWIKDRYVRRGGGETLHEAADRALNVIDRMLVEYTRNDLVVVISHGMVMRETMLRMKSRGTTDYEGDIPRLGNAEWIELSFPR